MFVADLTGTLRECRERQLIESPFSWTHDSDGIDDFIVINNHKYRLIVSSGTDPGTGFAYEEAVLRTESSRSDETIDIVLKRFP